MRHEFTHHFSTLSSEGVSVCMIGRHFDVAAFPILAERKQFGLASLNASLSLTDTFHLVLDFPNAQIWACLRPRAQIRLSY